MITDPASSAFVQRVEQHIAATIDRLSLAGNLASAMHYSAIGPGKRARPILTLYACQGVGGDPDAAIAPAAAVEMVHAFSLVHDDLPCLDDDDLRRGRPTAHIAFGEPLALLAGDGLLSLAFLALADAPESGRLSRELAIGTSRMVSGQVHDTLAGDPTWNAKPADERLHDIHSAKTGALLEAAARMGAIAAGCADDDPRLAALTDYAQAIGLLFQLTDDLIDATATTEHAGKRTRKDADAGKLTYPGLLGIERSRNLAIGLRDRAIADLQSLGDPAQPLRALASTIASRTK